MKFACFDCRKVFNKLEGKIQIDAATHQLFWTPPIYSCDECGARLHFTGAEFRPPRRQAVNQWEKAELLIRNGFLFHKNAGPYPETLSQARDFIKLQQRPGGLGDALPIAKEYKQRTKRVRCDSDSHGIRTGEGR